MIEAGYKNDRYRLHRLALLPLLPDATQDDIGRACDQLTTIDEGSFSAFVEQQGLAPMWDVMLEQNAAKQQVSEKFREVLRHSRRHATASYLIQRNKLKLIKEILEGAKITHAVYKGTDTRERLYPEPALRSAADIDVLVSEHKKIPAIRAFEQRGFEFSTSENNISHEASLYKGLTSIDLHWDILRPGRTRIPMTDSLVALRQDYDSHWGMCDEAALFVMLVHPVFAKYGTAPQASLIRMLDLTLMLTRRHLNWHVVLALLEKAGLKTAAWITLKWLELLTNVQAPAHLMQALKPGTLRKRYLVYWLQQDLSSKLLEKPACIKLGFTLPAHDQWMDAIRATLRSRALRKSRETDLNTLLQCTGNFKGK